MTFNNLKESNRNQMLDYMKDYIQERKNMQTPILINYSKNNYILEWLNLFDNSFVSDKSIYIPFRDKLKNESSQDLESAFKWTHDNFAELDLGGNMKWYQVLIDILFLKKNEDRESIYIDFMQQTRWSQNQI